ncbi:MAG: hypothetical protein M3014_08535, partial [Chloroflexota bacterium]|nr:hypothetical protein [Chloroflexota bacterium]
NVTVQKGSKVLAPPTRSRPTTPADQEADTVQVWPHLVVIEFLGAVIITINLVLLATLFNGPLEALANPDKTPNPSKAPWYFLNLQELLLHMNPALAGVIIPTVALGLVAIIPFVDRNTRGLGVWFYSPRGGRIAVFTAIYTTVVCASLVALDNFFPLKANFTNWLNPGDATHGAGFLSFLTNIMTGVVGGPGVDPATAKATALGIMIETVVSWVIPILAFAIFPILLVILLKIAFRGIDLSEIIIALFTGFVTVYWVLTFIGTAMRGPGMQLFPPWAVPAGSEGG